jgi:hypothetical protein
MVIYVITIINTNIVIVFIKCEIKPMPTAEAKN